MPSVLPEAGPLQCSPKLFLFEARCQDSSCASIDHDCLGSGGALLGSLAMREVYQHRRMLTSAGRPRGMLNVDFRMRQGTVRSKNERRVKEDLLGDTSVKGGQVPLESTSKVLQSVAEQWPPFTSSSAVKQRRAGWLLEGDPS